MVRMGSGAQIKMMQALGSEGLMFRYLVAVDVEGYSRRYTAQQARAQSALELALARAAESTGLERERWYRQLRGDGELAVLPQSADGLSLVADYPRELASSLADVNRGNREPRLRLRLAIHHGAVAPGCFGLAGNAPVTISRLVDAKITREQLRQRGDLDIALIVSATVYDEIVQSRLRSLDPDGFRRATVRAKGTSYIGYLCENDLGIPRETMLKLPQPGRRERWLVSCRRVAWRLVTLEYAGQARDHRGAEHPPRDGQPPVPVQQPGRCRLPGALLAQPAGRQQHVERVDNRLEPRG